MRTENLFKWEIEERERKQRLDAIKPFIAIPFLILAVFGLFYLLTKV